MRSVTSPTARPSRPAIGFPDPCGSSAAVRSSPLPFCFAASASVLVSTAPPSLRADVARPRRLGGPAGAADEAVQYRVGPLGQLDLGHVPALGHHDLPRMRQDRLDVA